MSNNTPDYENNLAFEPAKTAGTMATIARDGKAVAIRCYIDNQHYFDLTLVDAPDKMDWFDAKIWCEERYCRLPMKHELEFIGKNLKAINKMLKSVGGKPMKGEYWSSTEGSSDYAWNLWMDAGGRYYNYKLNNLSVRPVLAL